MDPTYHLIFDNGSQLALPSDMKFMQEQLESFEPGSFQGLRRYQQEGERHYQPVLDRLVNVGASTHPRTGMPTAMVSRRLVAQRIGEDLGV